MPVSHAIFRAGKFCILREMNEVSTAEMEQTLRQIRGQWRVWLGVLIGFGAVGYLFYRDFNPDVLSQVQWSSRAWIFLPLALLFMVCRDLGYIWRLRVLSEGDLSLRQAFRIVMLWEFTSAITPSAIGGTSVAIIFVHKEGLSVGRSSAVVLATSFLDEVYFLIMFPLLLLLVGADALFTLSAGQAYLARALLWITLGGYSLKVLYVLVLSYGFFINPRGLKWLILRIFRLPWLRKWRHGAHMAGSELVECSREFRNKGFVYWGKALASTFVSWTSRYWVANAIILAFFVLPELSTHFMIFSRQLVMWIMMLLSPTPGGSGFSEYIFSRYLGEFLPVQPSAMAAVAVVLALFWRLATYYPYLLMGAVVLPRWIRTNFAGMLKGKKREK